ncbi:hypothetical protein N7G274_000384 [Stereocaulon virgatum]|uniref:Uncharacterized protein n=1 Tax=Stereocaulon virgatum TaxID=373712 RepID=A0ABR4ARY8_9LECA
MASQRSVPPETRIIMQQRSLTRTREWMPKTPISEKSIVRNHSPYCESTGPIVHEGFVASRIRALQGLHDKAQCTTHSHSPMTPCPSRLLHKHRVSTSPTPAWSTRAIVKSPEGLELEAAEQLQEEVKVVLNDSEKLLSKLPAQLDDPFDAILPREVQESPKSPDENPGRKADYVGAIMPPQAQDDLIEPPESCVSDTPSTDALKSNESSKTEVYSPTDDAILSPRAIPAKLANPFNSWNDASGIESCDSEISPLRKIRPKISIADKLGSLVERGWVGMDVFGKAYNDRHTSDDVTSNTRMHNIRVKHRSRSSGDETRPFMLPLRKQLLARSTFKGHSVSYDLTALETSDGDELALRSAIVSRRERTHQQDGHPSPRRMDARRSGLDSEQFGSDVSHPDPPQKRRVFSIQHLTRLRSSQSQNFELDTIFPTQSLSRRSGGQDGKAVNHFMSCGHTVLPSKQSPAAHQNKQQGPISEPTSITPSLRRASTNTSLSTRSAKRSTSWFKKYRFLPKLVDSDHPPLLWDFSRAQSTNTATDKAKIDAHHSTPLHPHQHPQDANRVQRPADGGHEDEDGEIGVQQAHGTSVNFGPMKQAGPSQPGEVKIPPQDNEKHHKWEQYKLRIKTSRAFGLQGSDSEASIGLHRREPFEKAEHFTEHSNNPLPEHSPSRSKRPSKTNSTDRTYETAASPEQDVRKATQPSSGTSQASSPSASVRLRHDDAPGLGLSPAENKIPRPKSPANPPQRRRSDMDVHPSSTGAPVNASPKTVRRASKASNRSIKKIRVTITFDGAEELVIDAKLQRRGGLEDWRTLH